jgi:CubicO group peptidase (beta-lactamase class C family)
MAELLRGGIRDWPAITVESIPGSLRAYSNPGYCVLQLALEDSTGLSLHAFAKKRIFDPLGMDRSYFNEPLTEAQLAVAASGHLSKRSGGGPDRTAEPVPGKADMAPAAAGGLWSTPSDLAAVTVEVMAAWRGESDTVVDREGANLFLTPVTANQGLGIYVSGEGQAVKATHAGHMPGFITHLVIYPNAGKGAVVMSNSDGGRWLNRELIAAIAREYGWPDFPVRRTLAPASVATLQELVGTYHLDAGPGFNLAVRLEAGVAKGQVNDHPPFILEPTTDYDIYVLPQQSMELQFQRSDSGAIEQVVMRRAGETGSVYRRIATP